ncbi:MAG TPA: ester cyclase [Puia sp.]|nr:ester cyclase [Puia sp.]
MTPIHTLLSAILLMAGVSQAQGIDNNTKNKKMTTNRKNEEIIRAVFEQALNKKDLTLLKDLISDEYEGPQGTRGAEGFEKPLLPLLKAFPDIQWHIEDLIGQNDKVVVRTKWQATNTAPFNNLPPTGKTTLNEGIAIFTLKDGKVTAGNVVTDRLGFLQQLGVLPQDLNQLYNLTSKDQVNFIDKFFVPGAAKAEFYERMRINRTFIRTLPGFIKDEAYEHTDENGNLICVTIAHWANKEAMAKAREVVQAEYKREGFDMPAMLKRLNITMDRAIYTTVTD